MRRQLKLTVLAAMIGVALGVVGFTFAYAQGGSYLSDDSSACANCHIMQDHYSAWLKSSHRAVAVCNDCHTPPGLVGKYATKASNGFWHSFAFTTGWHPDPIRITPRNRDITNHACRKCHEELVEAIEGPHMEMGELDCIRCHDQVGHIE